MASAITTNVVGGLGNQLFLVANLLATAKRHELPAVLPRYPLSSSCEAPRPTYWRSIFESLDHFNVGADLPRGVQELVVTEQRPASPIQLKLPKSPCLVNLTGFFQSAAYFDDHPLIHQVIPPRLHALARHNLTANYAEGREEHWIGLHVRRGDYMRMQDVFEVLDFSYYDHAVRHLLGHALVREAIVAHSPTSTASPLLTRHHLLVFCEEGDSFARNLVGFFRAKYDGIRVSLVHPQHEKAESLTCDETQPREVTELLMLSHCHDVVMANSTFSWWGAYLNSVPLHRVVAPAKWFVGYPYPQSNHLYCDDWILV